MGLSADDYRLQIEQLVPFGPAWAESKVRGAWGEEMARLDARVWTLLDEADPRTTRELLTDWERVLGLPDDCMVDVDLSITERRRLVWQRLTEEGGQSRQYFIDLAARLGYPYTRITEYQQATIDNDVDGALYSAEDAFVWQVDFMAPADNYRLANIDDTVDGALAFYQPSLAECPIDERKPAHTTVIFTYLTDEIFELPNWQEWAYYIDLAIAALPEAT